MGSKLFMLNKNEMGSVFEESAYQEVEIFGKQNEAALQTCLENFPELIPATEIDSFNPPKFITIMPEARVTAGSIDILLLDSNAVLNVIETKLCRNGEIRKGVLGQALAYAACVALEWDANRIKREAVNYWQKRGKDFEEILKRELNVQDGDMEQFWAKFKKNIEKKNIRIIIVADKVPEGLKRAIDFIVNDDSEFEIYTLEIKLFKDRDGTKVLAPTIYGLRERKSDKTGWSSEQLREEIKREVNDVRRRRFLEILDACLELKAFGSCQSPTRTFRFQNKEEKPCLDFCCDGRIYVNLRADCYGSKEQMKSFIEQLNNIKAFQYKDEDVGSRALVNWLLEELTDVEFQKLKELVKKVYDKGF